MIVGEKLDGGNVAVAWVNGAIVQLIRAGYCAGDFRFEQHRLFGPMVYARNRSLRYRRRGGV